ncbi:tripartite ATP-independent transporter DctM subunit [Mesorhizobium sp. J18]|uniref:TRAP transporter large permease n=1 Tax=Mesorhizobium sp. J18 TaxID=935263 RepID=UPI0011998A2D|nr:TRAP transporter large permease subunit [Mesorhizobium sp. J18]TWG98913.1 tripartite ATP-independent transporter DctM subunit [Mesorhizobium sp. J18]
MEAVLSAGIVLGLIFFYLGLGVWVFAGLLLVAATALWLVLGMNIDRIGTIAANIAYRYASTWELAAIPMFIWMGEIIFRTDISDRLFRGLMPFVRWIPGRLLHANVLGCTLFAAVSGSSAATTATVGKITTAELAKRGYNRSLALGSLAGAGSLGLLIPPSIVMIVYGILAEVSVSRLFAAGILPGLMIAALYSGYIMIRAIINPDIAPADGERYGIGDYLKALADLAPIFILVVIVLGSIYTGIATPSEAAAVGVAAALVITLAMRQMTFGLLIETLLGAIRTSCMVCIILIAAAFLSTAMGYLHIPANVARAIGALDLSPFGLILILSVFYVVLGLFLDGVSIIVMSLPITFPLAMQAGFDPIWFGVYLVIMTEMGQVTPPVGFNLFVLQGLTKTPIGKIAIYSLPFFFLMGLGVLILVFFPDVALWLPRTLYG